MKQAEKPRLVDFLCLHMSVGSVTSFKRSPQNALHSILNWLNCVCVEASR